MWYETRVAGIALDASFFGVLPQLQTGAASSTPVTYGTETSKSYWNNQARLKTMALRFVDVAAAPGLDMYGDMQPGRGVAQKLAQQQRDKSTRSELETGETGNWCLRTSDPEDPMAHPDLRGLNNGGRRRDNDDDDDRRQLL